MDEKRGTAYLGALIKNEESTRVLMEMCRVSMIHCIETWAVKTILKNKWYVAVY